MSGTINLFGINENIANIEFNGDSIDIVRFNDEIMWERHTGSIPGQPGVTPPVIPPASYPTIPVSGGILNPTQAQLNAAAVGAVFRFNFNGSPIVGSGSVRNFTLPVGHRYRVRLWGASGRISQNVAIDTQVAIAWGAYIEGEFTVLEGWNNFFLLVPQHGRRVWAGMGLGMANTTATSSLPAFGTSRNAAGVPTHTITSNGGRVNLHTSTPNGNSSSAGAGAAMLMVGENNVNNTILAAGGAATGNNGNAAQTARGRNMVTIININTRGNPAVIPIGCALNAANTGGRRTGSGSGFPSGNNGSNATNGTGGHSYALTEVSPRWVGQNLLIPYRLENVQMSERAGLDSSVPDLNGMTTIERIA